MFAVVIVTEGFKETTKMAQQILFNSPPAIGVSSHKSSPVASPVNKDVLMLEEKLKKHADKKRIRVAEYFSDFDPLRSGSITKDQFRRSMDHHLGMSLTDREHQLLTEQYATGADRISYRRFVDKLEREFDSNDFSQDLSAEKESCKIEVPQFDERTKKLMQICAEYYKNRGIRVKTCYQDFDRHNMGYITLSQFHRSFPGPPEIRESDISLIAEYYLEPSTGLYNYLRFNSDIEVFWENEARNKKAMTDRTSLLQRKRKNQSVDEILHSIGNVVFKNGIRTTEFFCDHDKLRSGIITENQFICGLTLCLGQHLRLTREEIQKVAAHYKSTDGRICYKDFCDVMENAYTAPNLEQHPDQVVERPLHGQLHKGLNILSSEEERVLDELTNRLSNEVKRRRLLLYPYFKDFDRSKGYTRGVTKDQFRRVLDFVGLFLTPEELKLVIRKFEDPVDGDVNYSAFIQTIDEEYTGHVVEEVCKEQEKASCSDSTQSYHLDNEPVDVHQIITRIQKQVVVNRLRTCEYFQDFDPLRSGSITCSKFRQGLSSLGYPNLSTTQFKALCKRYEHPKLRGCIAWKAFVHEIDEAFRETSAQCPHSGEKTSEQVPDELVRVMQRLKQRIDQRRISLKPCFQDFDRHKMGYITKPQFRQCLTYLEIPASEEEMGLIEARFSNDKGFKYLELLRELQPALPLENKYEQKLETLTRDKLKLEEMSTVNETDDWQKLAESVMDKIKIKVCRERIRVSEFIIDYDKLRSGRVHVQSFIRALDLCGFKLTMKEMRALIERYRSRKDPNYVDYSTFSDEIESVFTMKDLEKMPTVEIEQFIPPEDVDLNQLSLEQEQILINCIYRLAERVRVRRIQLFPLFEDYDRVHIGSVTFSQFRRVLNDLELGGLLSDYELGIIFSKFGVKVGGRCDVYYIAFCEMVEEYSQS